jgi:YD repeat-containing protein
MLHNGRFRQDEVDLYIPGRGLDFVWSRSYQSNNDLDGYLGKRWDFSWGAHFKIDNQSGSPGTGRFSRGDGRRDLYTNPQSSGYDYVYTTFPTGYVDIECRVNNSTSEIQQTKRNGFKQTFDKSTGRLKTREDRYGNKLTVTYDAAGKLSHVKDTLDRYIYGPPQKICPIGKS